MTITVTPEDIIKRCLWLDYTRFILRGVSEDELAEVVRKNDPVALTEGDAYAIGLLRVIETDNLVHRFKLHVLDTLATKSTLLSPDGECDESLYINRGVLLRELSQFKVRFPRYYEPTVSYSKSISEMREYASRFIDIFENMETISVPVKDKVITYLKSRDVKKVLEVEG